MNKTMQRMVLGCVAMMVVGLMVAGVFAADTNPGASPPAEVEQGASVMTDPLVKASPAQMVIMLAVPVLVAVLKKVVPKIPPKWLPLIAILVGASADGLLAAVGLVESPGIGAILGAAGVGIRELKDQVFRPDGF